MSLSVSSMRPRATHAPLLGEQLDAPAIAAAVDLNVTLLPSRAVILEPALYVRPGVPLDRDAGGGRRDHEEAPNHPAVTARAKGMIDHVAPPGRLVQRPVRLALLVRPVSWLTRNEGAPCAASHGLLPAW